ncbi:thioredoxin-disulfide reductase [Candidatus Falkowbacteria bacterium RIFOXYB2_FULL_47_14]|uniref:Thioredoxin reductase n=1 Tax=Candidatus Falkowbacteria bacterium RIFOXYA2_FULL_47_19 TaxID=1797994 RepID=A0A1F5SG88_9BACT|nr:MAG: thioredoxin-disulfide reductase [Candidatus Falkowbacteria bacterium RIFOXYA2_FULL_47_19]OGF34920.1 MAG: thioredoxin-disulfide reductase [Candidatus Falkowbacteria bacterium RIFOXYC2_FULL_46_15]OGF43635.1 MAG: thioredoxin-disulfide reductase [Candidatus Falkowbacteria bacterium RIFOXYB2_FULL_47_14]
MYDLIIIGAGPAGITAGIYAVRREMKVLIIGTQTGGQVVWASEIENYPGFKNIQSYDFISKLHEQITGLGVEIKNFEIKRIEKTTDGVFKLFTEKEEFEAKTVIIAMGLQPRRLAIPGEEKFGGRGISYCANCDGPFYKNKTVAVVGGGNSALDAAEVLSKIASKVYLIHHNQSLKAFEGLVDEVKSRENIEMMLDREVKEISGNDKLEKIKILNCRTKEETDLIVDGLFIEIGRIAHTDLVKDLVKRDERDQVIVDEKCATSEPGIFAAGDVTQVPYKQITIATGQATIAALAAYQYLQVKSGKKIGLVMDRSLPKK